MIPGVDNATPHMLPLGRRLFDIRRLADVDGQFCLGPVMMESQSVSQSVCCRGVCGQEPRRGGEAGSATDLVWSTLRVVGA